MRLLIFLGLIYLGYNALKSRLLKDTTAKPVFNSAKTDIDDLMVRDPFCEIFFPRRDGVHLKVDGEDLYFCSDECKNKFVATRLNKM